MTHNLGCIHALEAILYPQLRSFPAGERTSALREARKTPFDVIELVGMAVGLILVTAITRYQSEEWWGAMERTGAALLNFAVAIPLLVVFVGPFLVRRVRRGLDQELAKRSAP